MKEVTGFHVRFLKIKEFDEISCCHNIGKEVQTGS